VSDLPGLLTFVDPTEHDSRYRICLWAEAGAGKTVAACSAPAPILAVSADRPGAYRYARRHHAGKDIREVRFENQRTLDDVYRYLRDTPEIRTVVLDPVGSIYDECVYELGGADPKGPHYQKVNKRLIGFLKSLRDLDLNVVLVAHEREDGDENTGIKLLPALGGPKFIQEVLKEMDIVAWCYRKPAEGEEPDMFMGQLVNARGRTCKDSTNVLGRTRELDLTEWIDTANAGLAPDESDLPWGPQGPDNSDADPHPLTDEELAAQEALDGMGAS
jgi:hypothetical protein